MSEWEPTDETAARRYWLVVFLVVGAFIAILVVGFAITSLISVGLD